MSPPNDSSFPPSDAPQPSDGEPPSIAPARDGSSGEGQSSEIPETESSEVEQSIRVLEEALQALKNRYADVLSAQARRSELRTQYNRTQSELSRHRTTQLKSELQALQQKIDEAEVTLESQLFSWSSLKEPFWMAVRFGGVGILVGWLLRSAAG